MANAVAPAYDLEDEIGRGGSGIVYRAIDRRLKRTVALKILPPDLAFRYDVRERFMREAETAARLSHPNIVPIFSVDEHEGLAWFVMALVEGENIGDRVRKRGAMPFADVRRIMREVADALAYAHVRGVVHRDIKPDNILLDGQSGRALVTDFGIARATTEGESRLTATGTAIGTPAYMSPEQCAGERELDGRSDLYSLGAVAYYMIAGQPPFEGPSTPVIMMKQVTEQPVRVSRYRHDVPRDLESIVMNLLEKRPDNRFASGTDLIAALDDGAFQSRSPDSDAEGDGPWGSSFRLLSVEKELEKTMGSLAETLGHPMKPLKPRGMPSLFEPVPGFQLRMETRAAKHRAKMQRREDKERQRESRPLPERIRSFRRHLASYVGSTTFLFGINAVTGGPDPFWWAFFPALGMMMGLANEGGSLWASGARIKDVFSGSTKLPASESVPGALQSPPAAASDKDAELIAEVLAGPRGSVARQAVADRRAIKDLVARLSKADREMLPDVEETSEGLYQRIAELGRALHRLDAEIRPESLAEIETRIEQTENSQGGTEQERRLRLLRRQRETLQGLLESRDRLSEQYESAGLLLQNLKLDLMRMRSSGLQSGLADVTSATQEARALSKEISYVLAAADELRDIDGRP